MEGNRPDSAREQVQPGVDDKLCCSPEGLDDTFVLCRSQGRKEKENAIPSRFVSRLEIKLNNLAHQAQIGKASDKQKVERRIGRLLERNGRAASLFNVTVTERGSGKDLRFCIHIKKRRALPMGDGDWRQLHPADKLNRK